MENKPLLRGHFHQAGFFVAFGAGAMLVAQAHSVHTFIPAIIYAISLIGMFGISALYHRPKWNSQWRVIMKRIDHAAIFVLIAGSGTPISLLALPAESGFKLFTTIWLAAALGVIKCVVWVHSPKWVSAILYVLVGWIAFTFINEIHSSLGFYQFWFLLVGGLVYSVGALIYGFKWPDPSPVYFGYHEIFHVLVLIGAALQFMTIQPLIN